MIATSSWGPAWAGGFAHPSCSPAAGLQGSQLPGLAADGFCGMLPGGGFSGPGGLLADQQLRQVTGLLLSLLQGMPGAGFGDGRPGLLAGGLPGFAGPGPAGPGMAGPSLGGFPPGGFPNGAVPGFTPQLGQGFQPQAGGPQAIQQLIGNPKSLGPGAGMQMLPPNASPDQCKQALEQRFGMPFEQIRQQYAQGKQDPKLKKKGALNKVGPAELYKQMMVEAEFGKIALKGHDGKVGGQGKLSGTRKSMAQVNDSYASLYQAKGGAAGAEAAAGAGGSSMALSLAVNFMTAQGVPASLALSVAMSGGAGGAAAGGGVQDQAAYAKAKASYEAAVKSGTPILLDLQGDGVPPVEDGEWKPHPHRFTARNKRMFDLDADGVKELVEWVNPGGAFLCLPDEGGDVPNGRHLFGDAGGFKDGYSKLAGYDQDQKGFVDLADMERNGLAVWVDENGDAVVDEGELRSCRELGISRVYTAHTDYKSTFVQDGQEKATWDWWPSYRKLTVGARAA